MAGKQHTIRGAHFAVVPFELLDDPALDNYAILTYIALRRFADFGGPNGCYASHTTLAKTVRISPETLKRRLKLLRQTGWVSWETGSVAGGTNTYCVQTSRRRGVGPTDLGVGPTDLGVGPTDLGVGLGDLGGRSGRPTTERQYRETSTESQDQDKSKAYRGREKYDEIDPEPASDLEFEHAWQLYPRRGGSNPKRDALRAWGARRAEGVSATELIDGVRRYAEYCQRTLKMGSEYVMQARRFFGPSRAFAEPWTPPTDPDRWKHDPTEFRPGESVDAYIARHARVS